MQRSGTSECDQCAAVCVLSAFDGMHSRCARHVLAYHFSHAECRGHFGESQRQADVFGQSRTGCSDIKPYVASREPLRINSPDQQIRIGHSRALAVIAIAGRPGIRPGALRSDRDPAKLVDLRDRAAARSDFHHVDDRHPKGESAVLAESVDSRDFETPAGLRCSAIEHA